MISRMKAPSAAIQFGAVFCGCAGYSNNRFFQDSVPAPQPPVGSPLQAVDDVVVDLFGGESIQQYDRWTVGDIITIAVRQPNSPIWLPQPAQ